MSGVENMVFPNNSIEKREQINEPIETREKRAPVAKGKASGKKANPIKKLAKAFIVEDLSTVREYMISDFIIPGIKNLFLDTLYMMLWGESRPSAAPTVKSSLTSKISYNKMYKESSARKPQPVKTSAYEYDDEIVFASKGEAELVLDSLIEIIDTYDVASVADLYDLSQVDSQRWTDNKYGWTDLSKASTRRTRDGYVLVLPKAYPIND